MTVFRNQIIVTSDGSTKGLPGFAEVSNFGIIYRSYYSAEMTKFAIYIWYFILEYMAIFGFGIPIYDTWNTTFMISLHLISNFITDQAIGPFHVPLHIYHFICESNT